MLVIKYGWKSKKRKRYNINFQVNINLLCFRKLGREFGSILFCTTGILLQHIQRDSALNYYSHIIIDEIHERDTISDFTLTILKSIIPVVNINNLKSQKCIFFDI